MEPWDALDVDDSDIPSLLRPCKRRCWPSSTTSSAAANAHSPQPSANQLENHPQQLQPPPPPSTSGRPTIPGPAGAVQEAMIRKNLDRGNHNFSDYADGETGCNNGDGHGVIPTQDYIRRAMEDTSEFDGDFSSNPWLSALQYLGVRDGAMPTTHISSIKKSLKSCKVDQIVAVIKSCTPNGLGGLMLNLKDPTGSVGASVHHKVLSESDFGQNLTVGAVLILNNVAIFSPARSAQYLNITVRNLVKVFCQDSSAPVRKDNSTYPTRYVDAHTEYRGKAKIVENISSVQNIAMEETGKDRRQNQEKQTTQNDSPIQILPSAGSCQQNYKGNYDVTAAVRQGHMGHANGGNKSVKGSNAEGILNNTPVDSVSDCGTQTNGEKTQGTNEVQIQRQPLIVRPSLAQWTDEQLDELFAGDEE